MSGNPDAMFVEFRREPVQNNFKSRQAGRPIYEDQNFVTVQAPGSPNTVYDGPVREDHKQRFPHQWMHFVETQENPEVRGTIIDEWTQITRSKAMEYKGVNVLTVEQLAGMSDGQCQSCGIMGAMSDRKMAQDWLNAADATAQANQAADVEAVMAENAKLQNQMAEMMAKLEKLESKPKRGRPKKPVEAEAVEDGGNAAATG